MKLRELGALLRRNQRCTKEFLLGRTEIQSTLVPTPPYIVLSCVEIFDRQPAMLRAIEEVIPPEALGRRIREPGHPAPRPVGGLDMLNVWALTSLYLWGRQFGLGLGLWGPSDRAEDIAYTLDFTRRLCRGYRDDRAFVAFDGISHVDRPVPRKTMDLFHAHMRPVGSRSLQALKRLNGVLFTYTFLDSMECRKNTCDSGPYPSPFSDDEILVVRDYYAMAQDAYPWSVAGRDLPYHSLTMVFALKGVAVRMPAWATPTFSPSDYLDRITRAGVFSRDGGEWRVVPSEDLLDIADAVQQAHLKLYRDVSSWDMRTKIMSGAKYYLYECSLTWAQEAGLYSRFDTGLSRRTEELYAKMTPEKVGELFTSLIEPYTPVGHWSAEGARRRGLA